MNHENDITIRISKQRIQEFMRTRTFYFILFCLTLMLLFQRHTSVLVCANFWAEDGTVFYSQMHSDGIISFFYPYAGYMHLLPRLTVLIAMPFGVINGPLVINFIALILHTLPVLFLFTKRFDFVGTAYKFFLAVYYILMPNAGETLGNIANIQWHTALMLLMVLSANPPENFMQRLQDMLILICAGLSGPFIIFLVPFILFTRKESMKFKLIALCIAVIQITAVIFTAEELHSKGSFDSVSVMEIISWLIRVIDTRLIYGTFMPYPVIFAWILRFIPALSVIIFLVFAVPFVYFFMTGSNRFRICAIFGACVMFSSIFRVLKLFLPGISEGFTSGGGERYFVIPCMLFFTFIMFMIKRFIHKKSEDFRLRVYCCISVVLIAVGLISFSQFQHLGSTTYRSDITNIYYPAQKGETVIIPINPQGWTMTLIKK